MATIDIIDFNNTSATGDCVKLVNNIIDCLGTYIDFRVSQECNMLREKHPDTDITLETISSRITVMLISDDEYEERHPEDFIAEVRHCTRSLIFNATLENRTYDLLKFTIESFDEHCIMCLDGKPIKDGEFISLEEAKRACNTID